MSRSIPPRLDPRAVRQSFNRAAARYDRNASLQREIADRLVSRLDLIKLQPESILDLGCGTGYVSARMQNRFRRAQVTGLDVAQAMTRSANRALRSAWPFGIGHWLERTRFVTASAEQLPFPAARFDLVISNLTLQWCRPDLVFAECARVLRPGGLLLFTSFGPDTLQELRAAWREVDAGTHVHEFTDMHDLGDALVGARLADPVMDAEVLTLTYEDIAGVLADLKGIGAHNASPERHAGLTGKDRFARFRQAYEVRRRPDGRLPATYEVVYGHAWAAAPSDPAGTVRVPVDQLRGRRR